MDKKKLSDIWYDEDDAKRAEERRLKAEEIKASGGVVPAPAIELSQAEKALDKDSSIVSTPKGRKFLNDTMGTWEVIVESVGNYATGKSDQNQYIQAGS